jgi:hypothetical protein
MSSHHQGPACVPRGSVRCRCAARHRRPYRRNLGLSHTYRSVRQSCGGHAGRVRGGYFRHFRRTLRGAPRDTARIPTDDRALASLPRLRGASARSGVTACAGRSRPGWRRVSPSSTITGRAWTSTRRSAASSRTAYSPAGFGLQLRRPGQSAPQRVCPYRPHPRCLTAKSICSLPAANPSPRATSRTAATRGPRAGACPQSPPWG